MTIICDASPAVGKGPIRFSQSHKHKTTKENTDESQELSDSMVFTGRC